MSLTGVGIEAALPTDLSGLSVSARSGRTDQAARDFESLLLTQLLRSAHQAGGWLGASDDDPDGAVLGIAEEHLASVISANGGLGLARLIQSGLNRPASDSEEGPQS